MMNNDVREAVREFEEEMKASEEFQKERSLRKQIEQEYKTKMRKLKFKVGITCFVAGGLLIPMAAKAVNTYNSEYYKQERAVNTLSNETKIHGGYKIGGEYVYSLERHEEECELEGEGSVYERIDDYCEKNNLSDAISDMAKEKFHCYYNDEFEKGDEINLIDELTSEYEEENVKGLSN